MTTNAKGLVIGFQTHEGFFCCKCRDFPLDGALVEGDGNGTLCDECGEHLDRDDCKLVEGGCDCGNALGVAS